MIYEIKSRISDYKTFVVAENIGEAIDKFTNQTNIEKDNITSIELYSNDNDVVIV